jgi:REP-associated tyrosine transposase
MPDHCHFILAGLNPSANLSAMMRAFKGHAAVAMRRFGIRGVWQKSFYDHIIRNAEDLSAATVYLFENPVRAGFVKDISDWPFSGSFVFDWRSFASAPSLPLSPIAL